MGNRKVSALCERYVLLRCIMQIRPPCDAMCSAVSRMCWEVGDLRYWSALVRLQSTGLTISNTAERKKWGISALVDAGNSHTPSLCPRILDISEGSKCRRGNIQGYP